VIQMQIPASASILPRSNSASFPSAMIQYRKSVQRNNTAGTNTAAITNVDMDSSLHEDDLPSLSSEANMYDFDDTDRGILST
jgi:hypothetical protein